MITVRVQGCYRSPSTASTKQRGNKHRHAKHTRQHKTPSTSASVSSAPGWLVLHLQSPRQTSPRNLRQNKSETPRENLQGAEVRREGRLTWGLERCWCCVVLHLTEKLRCEQQSQESSTREQALTGDFGASGGFAGLLPPSLCLLP